mmetsp:Transcript_42696/g.69216  ORF Transcript_42696/g.69216 Transcript_42696/m.69216 type:complete len:226 (-) Transcript_42696:1572-2249(-)
MSHSLNLATSATRMTSTETKGWCFPISSGSPSRSGGSSLPNRFTTELSVGRNTAMSLREISAFTTFGLSSAATTVSSSCVWRKLTELSAYSDREMDTLAMCSSKCTLTTLLLLVTSFAASWKFNAGSGRVKGPVCFEVVVVLSELGADAAVPRGVCACNNGVGVADRLDIGEGGTGGLRLGRLEGDGCVGEGVRYLRLMSGTLRFFPADGGKLLLLPMSANMFGS